MYDAIQPTLKVTIDPIDPNAGFDMPTTIIESFAGLLKAGFGDIATSDASTDSSFAAQDWSLQTALYNVSGPLEWVRLASGGRLYRGIVAAKDSQLDREICGFTVALRKIRTWNKMVSEPIETLAPRIPADAEILQWKAKQGSSWETVLPAKDDAVTLVRHRHTPSNTTVKVVTDKSLAKGEGFEMVLDMGGIASSHRGEPAMRVMWGNSISIVFRGKGLKPRPQIEIRERGKWNVQMVLVDSPALDDLFWKTRHLLRVYRLGGQVVVELDGIGYHFLQFDASGDRSVPIPATWPKAPVEVSIVGPYCLIGLSRLSGETAGGAPLVAQYSRLIGAPKRISGGVSFGAKGERPVKVGTTVSMLLGDMLDNIEINGTYQAAGVINYTCKLICDEFNAPLLCAFASRIPGSPSLAPPPPVDVSRAVNEWQVVSSDPESGQDGEATFSLSRSLLLKLVPNWENVIVPYRGVTISLKPAGGAEVVLFRGWIKPNNFDVKDNAEQTIGVVCGDVISERLNLESALVDERFAPIDLSLDDRRSAIWGAEAVRDIIGTILGPAWSTTFNDGNPFKYCAPGTPPLLDNQQGTGGLAFVLGIPQKSNFYFPPPFGDSTISFINTIAEYDSAVLYYDPIFDRLYYGDPVEILIERGATVHVVSPDFIATLSNQAEFEQSYNDVRVWGPNDPSIEAFQPSLLMGRAGDSGDFSLLPTSRAQSWTRTLLFRPEYVRLGIADQQHVQEVAFYRWLEQEGRVPARFSLDFDTGFLGPRWGEKIKFPAPGDAYTELADLPERRITKVIHGGSLTGQGNPRFQTTIEARSLTAGGQ